MAILQRPVARASPPTTAGPALQTRARGRDWVADLALLGPIVALATALRLVNLGAYSGLFDEGIRVEQLFLMSRGFRPFKDIFAAQGPLLLDALYPLYGLFDRFDLPPLVAVRLAPVAYSLVGLAGLYWLGRQLGGRLGGTLAALLLALSPLYLEGSRLALAEVPALAPAIVAVGCGLRYQARGRFAWLAAAGLLLSASLLMKPITLAAAPAVAVAALSRGRRGLRDLAIVGGAMLLLSAALVWALGFAEIQSQIVDYRRAAAREFGWSLRKNLATIEAGLGFEPLALVPLGLLGGLLLLAERGRRALPVVVWASGGVLLLLGYSPLHGKHIVVMIPALALLAGAGLARATHLAAGVLPANRRQLALAPLALAAVWYALGLAPLLGQTGQLLRVTADTDVDPAFDQYNDAVAVLRGLTGPDDFLVTDQPYLAFLAERMVPPRLVDTALTRIRSRSLTGGLAVAQAETYGPTVVLLWGDRLRSLASFKAWVDQEYQVVKVYNRRGDTDRALYLRRDQNFAAARALLAAGLTGPGADFAGELRLAGSAIDRTEIASGQGATVTLAWALLRPASADYHVLLELRGADGRAVDEQEESLGGGSDGPSDWQPGRWVVQSSFVLAPGVPAGQYSVVLALYDSRSQSRLPIDGAGGARALPIGTLAVR